MFPQGAAPTPTQSVGAAPARRGSSAPRSSAISSVRSAEGNGHEVPQVPSSPGERQHLLLPPPQIHQQPLLHRVEAQTSPRNKQMNIPVVLRDGRRGMLTTEHS